LSHVRRSTKLLRSHNLDDALREAQTAVQLAPHAIQTQMKLGDALASSGHSQEALEAYENAAVIIESMEPEARLEWQETIKKKISAIKPK
jgi:Flp pilus assembly protein TadD